MVKRLSVRIDAVLAKRLEDEADRNHRSVNSQIVFILENALFDGTNVLTTDDELEVVADGHIPDQAIRIKR